ncbi:MAG: DALR anticodon-binding domain-containing protein, partial [Gammaproteobacteria bacterium]
WDQDQGLQHLSLLQHTEEKELMSQISRFPELVVSAALAREPHQIAHYLRDLASALHVCYNAHIFIADDGDLRDARLCMIMAAKQIFVNGLKLLSVSAPEQM